MADFSFTSLANGAHVTFDASTDRLMFAAAVHAGLVRFTEAGTDLGATYLGKTVWLDGTSLAGLRLESINFANDGLFAAGDATAGMLADWYGQETDLSSTTVSNQLQGLGGADFLRGGSGNDLLVGNAALTPLNHISRVDGTGAPTATHRPTISADGRFVGFDGGWTGFGSVDNNSTDILVKDIVNNTVSNEHQNEMGVAGGSGSGEPVISADGRFVAFLSASNLVGTTDGSLYGIYVASLDGTAIERVSTGTGGTLATDGRSLNPDLSGDGNYVVFESTTSNWAAGGSTSTTDIFLKDRVTGDLTRVSTNRFNTADGNGDSADAQISKDGNLVVFESTASNLTAGDTNGRMDVFVFDRPTGDMFNLSDFMVGARNPANTVSNADVAYDSQWGIGTIVFETAKGLTAADTNNQVDVYAFDILTEKFKLVSSKANGTGVQLSSGDASISGDGRFVVFTSGSAELVAGDNNGSADVFVKDLFTGQIALVSRTAAGGSANQSSGHAQISLGGDFIVFESSASNLAATDVNGGLPDVFRISNPLLQDTLAGGGGNDTYMINRKDVIVEALNAGVDKVLSSITYSLGANVEKLELTGAANLAGTGNTANNVLTGNEGSNKLSGLSGNDMLVGGGGNDVLTGGVGRDTLMGGAGNDVFDFNGLAELGLGAARDSIKTWNAGDKIDLSGIDANAALAGNQAFAFRGAAAFNGTGQVRYANGVLQFNTDADLAAEFEIAILGAPPLVAGASLLL
jgi:Ca2+-binding RTX toxin-like protein